MVKEHNYRRGNQPPPNVVVSLYSQADGKDSYTGRRRQDQIYQQHRALSALLNVDQRKVGPLRGRSEKHDEGIQE